MNENSKTIEELQKEIELLKKTIEVQKSTIARLINTYVLGKVIRNEK